MARPIPITAAPATTGSTEDLENKSLQTFEHCRNRPQFKLA